MKRAKSHCRKGHLMDDGNLAIMSSGARRCRECHNTEERDRKAKQRQEKREANPKPEKVVATHCHKGHSLEGENLYVRPNGGRDCRACRNINACNRRIERKQEHLTDTSKVWRENNKEQVATYNKIWHEINRAQRLQTMKAWKTNNKERVAASNKAWRAKNRERVAASTKAWRDNNRDKRRQHEEKRRALLSGAAATLTNDEWMEIEHTFNGKCFWCGANATTMEHIVPLQPRPGELQGHHTKGNVVPSCRPCNSSKINTDPLKFYFKNQRRKKESSL